MSHTCHDQRYGPRSDTLADAQEQKIFNSVILTYPTEDQTGRRTAPPRQETPSPANWIRDHQRRSSHITTTREEHKLSPTSYRARFNSIQRSSSSMSNKKHHLSLEPHAVWICDVCKKFFFLLFFVFIVHHIYMLINKYKTYKVYQSIPSEIAHILTLFI